MADDVEFVFASKNERSFKQIKIKLEVIMEKRMLGRYLSLHKYLL